MTKISIIIPIYKILEPYLRHCVFSCINQTYKNIEIILVEDGSPDNCGAICDELKNIDNRIIVIHKSNGGLVSARNAGFDVITGDWHMYLDGDDWIDTNTCEELVRIVDKNPDLDVVFWKFLQEMNGKSVKSKMNWACDEDEHLYINDECHELARNTMIYSSGLTTAYAKLINTGWAKSNNIRHDVRLRQGEEGVEFTLRLFYHAKRALYLNRYWNHYRYVEGSITKQVNEKNTEYITDCFKVMQEDILGFKNRDAVMKMFYQRVVYGLIAIAFSTYFHPDNKEALSIRKAKFKRVIDGSDIYRAAIKKCPLEHMDKARIITFYFIKYRAFLLLQMVSYLKQFMVHRGKFDY